MKKFQFLLFALLVSATTLTFTSCGDDNPCKDVECGTNGECFEGDCVCNVGFEKDAEGKCTVDSRTKFVGNYNSSETCVPASSGSYSNSISSGSAVNKLTISNFGDSALNATATIDGTNKKKFTLDATSFDLGGTTFTITGSGEQNSTGVVITLNYEAKTGGATAFTCVVTMNKI